MLRNSRSGQGVKRTNSSMSRANHVAASQPACLLHWKCSQVTAGNSHSGHKIRNCFALKIGKCGERQSSTTAGKPQCSWEGFKKVENRILWWTWNGKGSWRLQCSPSEIWSWNQLLTKPPCCAACACPIPSITPVPLPVPAAPGQPPAHSRGQSGTGDLLPKPLLHRHILPE